MNSPRIEARNALSAAAGQINEVQAAHLADPEQHPPLMLAEVIAYAQAQAMLALADGLGQLLASRKQIVVPSLGGPR